MWFYRCHLEISHTVRVRYWDNFGGGRNQAPRDLDAGLSSKRAGSQHSIQDAGALRAPCFLSLRSQMLIKFTPFRTISAAKNSYPAFSYCHHQELVLTCSSSQCPRSRGLSIFVSCGTRRSKQSTESRCQKHYAAIDDGGRTRQRADITYLRR